MAKAARWRCGNVPSNGYSVLWTYKEALPRSGLRGGSLSGFGGFHRLGRGNLSRVRPGRFGLLRRLDLFAGSQDGVQGGAFHARMKLHDASVANVLNQAIDDLISQFAVSHLATTETQGRLHLVAFMEKADGLIFLGLVVVLVHGDRELDFLDGDNLLLFARSPFALIFFVQILAVILNAADRRHGVRRDLYQVEAALAGNFESFKGWENAELFSIFVNDANFTRAYPIVDADKLFRRTLIDVSPPGGRGYTSPREYTIPSEQAADSMAGCNFFATPADDGRGGAVAKFSCDGTYISIDGRRYAVRREAGDLQGNQQIWRQIGRDFG
jgi:hypothetical protein